jgi:hypothetical protein
MLCQHQHQDAPCLSYSNCAAHPVEKEFLNCHEIRLPLFHQGMQVVINRTESRIRSQTSRCLDDAKIQQPHGSGAGFTCELVQLTAGTAKGARRDRVPIVSAVWQTIAPKPKIASPGSSPKIRFSICLE